MTAIPPLAECAECGAICSTGGATRRPLCSRCGPVVEARVVDETNALRRHGFEEVPTPTTQTQPQTLTGFRKLQREIHETAVEKGWYDPAYGGAGSDPAYGGARPGSPPSRNFGELIALVHSELSESLEAYRNGNPAHHTIEHGPHGNGGKPEGWGVELADVVIRVLDMCEYMNVDLEALIRIKMAYNKTRPYRHGGKKM